MKKKSILIVSIVVLAVMVALMCVACADTTPDPDRLQKTLQNKSYTVNHYDAGANDEGVIHVLYAFDENDENPDTLLIVYWYISKDAAKAGFEDNNTDFDEPNYVVKRKGNAVIIGIEELAKLV